MASYQCLHNKHRADELFIMIRAQLQVCHWTAWRINCTHRVRVRAVRRDHIIDGFHRYGHRIDQLNLLGRQQLEAPVESEQHILQVDGT